MNGRLVRNETPTRLRTHFSPDSQQCGWTGGGRWARVGQAFRSLVVVGMMVAGCDMPTGITPPAAGDISEVQRPASPNTCLAAPVNFKLAPDLPTHQYNMPPEQLFAAVRDIIMARPRTLALAADPVRLRADYLVRSRVFGFPDIVLVQALRTKDGSDLALYSYSLTGYYDFGVNHGRVAGILAALDAELAAPR